jgi:HME family heavy-metal exporter
MHSDVVATVQKQPNANTIEVTRQIETALAALRGTLPADVTIETKAFQQATFMKGPSITFREPCWKGAFL